MLIQENVNLAPYTTFKIGGPAKFFCDVENTDEIKQAVGFAKFKNLPIFILGGGSNVLISDTGFEGLVIHPQIKGLEVINEDDASVLLKMAAGESWDGAVELAVSRGWWGIENLSHIPGNCGGFAVQNVGAYGQEASQVVEDVEAFNIQTCEVINFANPDCNFTYRHSIFNTTEKNNYIILSTTIRLSKTPKPNLSYGDVKKYFGENTNPSIKDIRKAITEIRNTKFPYPTEAKNGNAGSFFRGPMITPEQLKVIEGNIAQDFGSEASLKLQGMLDRLKVPQGYKTPTAFLMELCRLKGFQIGGAQINPAQPAIVLNVTGQATAEDVLKLKSFVLNKVSQTFGVDLEVEPELLGFVL